MFLFYTKSAVIVEYEEFFYFTLSLYSSQNIREGGDFLFFKFGGGNFPRCSRIYYCGSNPDLGVGGGVVIFSPSPSPPVGFPLITQKQ